MESLLTFINNAVNNEEFRSYVQNRMTSFELKPDGENRSRLGQFFMPLLFKENEYSENGYRLEQSVGYDDEPDSPLVADHGLRTSKFMVRLGSQSKAYFLTPQDVDTLMGLERNGELDSVMDVVAQHVDMAAESLKDVIERQSWEAMLKAQVEIRFRNQAPFTLNYPNPAGHRVSVGGGTSAAPAGWNDPNYDIAQDLNTALRRMGDVTHIVCSHRIANLIQSNNTVRAQMGMLTFNPSLNAFGVTQNPLLSMDDVNRYMTRNRLPSIIVYDDHYRVAKEGTAGNASQRYRFLDENSLIMFNNDVTNSEIIGTRDLTLAEQQANMGSGIGYVGNGRVVQKDFLGQSFGVFPTDTQTVKGTGLRIDATQRTLPVMWDTEATPKISVFEVPETSG